VAAQFRLAVKPREIRLRLRSPDGRPLRRAEVDGRPTSVLANDLIELPAGTTGNYRIVGHFK
jgi:hypothetical protein